MDSGGDVGGSEDYSSRGLSNHICSTCSKDDKSTEASHYCPECDTCYCKACLCDHTVIGRAGIQNWGKPQSANSDQEIIQTAEHTEVVGHKKCLHHTDMDVEFYCQDHDVVFCKLCFSATHRKCSKAENIDKMINIKLDDDITFIRETIQRFTRLLRYAQSETKLRTISTRRSHQRYLEHLEVLRGEMNAEFDQIKEASFITKYQISSKIEADSMICQSFQNDVPKFKEMLQDSDDLKTQVICKKKCKELLKTNENYLKKLRNEVNKDREIFLLTHEDTVQNARRSMKCLGDIKLERSQYNVRMSEDEKTCEVVGACQLTDGRIVILDTANKCLKVLNEDMSVVNSYKFTDAPVGMCLINSTDVAVGMDNKTVEIFSIAEKVDVLRTLKLDRDCSHLAISNNTLHIAACHNCGSQSQKGCSCSISIYKYNVLTGEAEGTIRIDHKPNHSLSTTSTLPLEFSTDASQIYIAGHGYDYFLLCDKKGKELGSVNPYVYSPCTSMCHDDSVNVYCIYSDTVYKFDTTNVSNIVKTLEAKPSDGIPRSLSMAWNRNVGRVIIGGKNDNLYMICNFHFS